VKLRYLTSRFETKPEYTSDYDFKVHHTKAIVIAEPNGVDLTPSAIYVGSHNLSAGAWGTENHKDVRICHNRVNLCLE
jgi:hypothetical protein